MITVYSADIREPAVVDAIMDSLPVAERRWCGMDRCDCSGCANRLVSRDEWMAWFTRQKDAVCARCADAVYRLGRDGRRQLACETCGTFWA